MDEFFSEDVRNKDETGVFALVEGIELFERAINDEEFMNMIYIALGVLGLALILFVVLFLLKRKLCPEKEPEESKNEIEVASPE